MVRRLRNGLEIRAEGWNWGLIDCISYYARHRFRTEPMPDEIWAVYFQGQDWYSFVPEEQIRFEGGTMYLVVY